MASGPRVMPGQLSPLFVFRSVVSPEAPLSTILISVGVSASPQSSSYFEQG